VSARHPGSLAEVARDAGVDGLAICSNGATVYDLDGKRVVRERTLSTEVASKLVRELRQTGVGCPFRGRERLGARLRARIQRVGLGAAGRDANR
jgi:hydroxymethylpyrimidine pyrophosphatase-like HAD family hydrolase